MPPSTDAWTRRSAVAIAGSLTVIAALVRALARTGRPMWFDEAFTVALARIPGERLAASADLIQANGGLYVLLARAALRAGDALGVDELAAARLGAAVAGVVAVPVLYLLGRRLVGDAPAALAALLLAVSRFHAYYSLEARGYTLVLLLLLLSAWALAAALEAPGPAPALAFALLAPLATSAHAFAALALAAQGGAALLHPSVRGERGPATARAARAWLAVALSLGAAGSAAVLRVWARNDAGQLGWIAPLAWGQVRNVLVSLAGNARLLLVPALAGAVAAVRLARRGGARRFGAALALAWCFVPVALAIAVSAVKPLLHPRYLIVALPGFLLLVALGVVALRRPRWIALGAAVAVAAAARELGRPRRGEPVWQPFDAVAARVVELARPGDALVVSSGVVSLSLDRELRRLGRPGPERVEPPQGDPLGFTPRAALEERLAGRSGVICVLTLEAPDVARACAALAAAGRVTADEDRSGVRVLRVER